MNELATQQTMTSREIAALAGKMHNDVMKAIRAMEPAWKKINGGGFSLVEYRDAKGERRPQYQLTKAETLYVATKFNDEARARLVLRWEDLEAQEAKNAIDLTNADTVLQIAQNYKAEQDRRIRAEKTISRLAPKAELMDKVMDTDKLIDIGQCAKILELPYGRNTLHAKLRKCGVFFKGRNEPKQEYVERKYFVLKQKLIKRKNKSSFTVLKVLVTQKGLSYLAMRLGVARGGKQLMLIQ